MDTEADSPGEDARARAVLAALASLSDDALRQAADASPAPVARMLRDLVRARAAEEPEAAVAAVMRDAVGAEALQDMVKGVARRILSVPRAQAPAAEQVFTPQARDTLERTGEQVREGIEDPAIAEVLQRGLDLLKPDGPLGRAAAGAEELVQAQEALRDVATRLAADPTGVDATSLQRTLADLRAQRDQLQSVVGELSQVDALLDELQALATGAGQGPQAARLAAARAGLLDRLQAPEDRVELALWQALDLSEAAGLLVLARDLGRRLRQRAMASGDLSRVTRIADRLAGVAHADGDLAAEVAALGQAATAYARLPGGGAAARLRVDRAYQAAELDLRSALWAQATLSEGLVLEQLGDTVGARKAYRELMGRAAKDPSFPYELGWAALHLGALEGQQGQLSRSRKNLALAAAIGAKAPDWLLYAMACRARFDLAERAGDQELAREVLRGLSTEGLAIAGSEATALREELGARLQR